MSWLIALIVTGIARYLTIKLTEEIESMSAGLVACLGIFVSVFLAPLLLKLAILAILLIFPKINLV